MEWYLWVNLLHSFRVWFYIFSTRFEFGFTSSPLVSSVVLGSTVVFQYIMHPLIGHLVRHFTSSPLVSGGEHQKSTLETSGEDVGLVLLVEYFADYFYKIFWWWPFYILSFILSSVFYQVCIFSPRFECVFPSSPLVLSVFFHLLHPFRV